MSARWRWFLALLVVVHVAVGVRVAFTANFDTSDFVTGDQLRYREVTHEEGRPWRDFEVAFPPVTYAYLAVVAGHGDTDESGRWLVLTQLVCDLVVAAALVVGWGIRPALTWLALLVPFLWDGWIFGRVDLLSVALAIGGLAAARRHREGWGGILLAAAALAKVWAVFTVPGLVMEGRRRAAAVTVVALAAGGVAWIWFGGADAVRQVVTFRDSTGWQIESTVGAVVHWLGAEVPRVEGGAWRIGQQPDWTRPLSVVGVLGAGAAAWALAWRAHRRGQAHAAESGSLLAVLALVLLAPILSPQYLVWVLPFVAILAVRAVTAAMAAAVVLTALASHWYDELRAGDDWWAFVVVARNLCLIAVAVLVLMRLLTGSGQDVAADPEARAPAVAVRDG